MERNNYSSSMKETPIQKADELDALEAYYSEIKKYHPLEPKKEKKL